MKYSWRTVAENEHKPFQIGPDRMATYACQRCGIVMTEETGSRKCVWGAQLERETPKPGGLDRLGVVKELRLLCDNNIHFLIQTVESRGDIATGTRLMVILHRLQQLISRLDGQGADESVGVKSPQATDASEPEGQCSGHQWYAGRCLRCNAHNPRGF